MASLRLKIFITQAYKLMMNLQSLSAVIRLILVDLYGFNFILFFSFTDINECVVDNGGCSQLCINTQGHFYCTCQPEYVLDFNNKTCLGNHREDTHSLVITLKNTACCFRQQHLPKKKIVICSVQIHNVPLSVPFCNECICSVFRFRCGLALL